MWKEVQHRGQAPRCCAKPSTLPQTKQSAGNRRSSSGEAARRNAEALGIEARYVASRVESSLETWSGADRDAGIILNPGRSGCHPDVVRALGAVPSRLAYLSCNPVTLARDLAALGRTAQRVIPLDLMPQTDHTEVLALI